MPGLEIIDRESERADLLGLLKSGRPHLALLTGRRRVGKTFLLTHAWEGRPFFFFTAARTTHELNRRQLLEDLAVWSEDEIHVEDYPTWRSVFNLLLDFRTPEPLVVVLDEFQYLADGADGLAEVASELNAAWEKRRPDRAFVLALSGSAVGSMEALAAGGGPLYGRFSWQHKMQPFGYSDAARMVPFESPRDRALVYGVFGGTPRYLAAVDPKRSLAWNIRRLLLHPNGEVRLLLESALDQEEGLRDTSKYRGIVRAVTDGCTKRNEIAQRTGLQNDSGLRDKLDRLIDLGYLVRRQYIDARPNDSVRYAVEDPALRFHQRFVAPAASLLLRYGDGRVWNDLVAPNLDSFMGLEFERMAAQAYDRIGPSRGFPLVRTWGRWEGVDRAGQSLEIDLVGRLVGGGVLTGAVKWNRSPIGSDVHWAHMDMLRRAAESGRSWAHRAVERDAHILYLAAGGYSDGFREAVEKEPYRIALWSLEDLYEPS